MTTENSTKDSTEKSADQVHLQNDAVSETSSPIIKPTLAEEFAKTATAAKLSGTFHEVSGKIKRKFGEYRDDKEMQDAGRDQEILGKVHRLVGHVRDIRQTAIKKWNAKRKEGQDICIKHGGRVVDVAADFVEDVKKLLLK
ncbi:MAG: hypothetical protein IT287_09515 [Bdellovibrionaceae bacterium]|nr:hypothetical protein [Pseudobdellovibrionaceae bacterium]